MAVVEEAEAIAELPALLAALKLTVERVEKLRGNPFKKIPDTTARRCERHLNKPKGWLDEPRIEDRYCEPLPPDMRDLIDLYLQLSEDDRRKLYEMGRILLDILRGRRSGKSRRGEEIIVTCMGHPVARITRYEPAAANRRLGSSRGGFASPRTSTIGWRTSPAISVSSTSWFADG
jgi:antitoxin (DNA-binding transcriptional repressor) of toxin-antitoxin stability system